MSCQTNKINPAQAAEEIAKLKQRLRELEEQGFRSSIFDETRYIDDGWIKTLGISKFPRLCSLLLGIVVPLGVLSMLSLTFGMILSKTEGHLEVERNDKFMAAVAISRDRRHALTNMTAILPVSCVQADLLAFEFSDEYILNMYNELRDSSSGEIMLSDELKDEFMLGNEVLVNTTRQIDFVEKCGKRAAVTLDGLYEETEQARINIDGTLTFDWIRCFDGASGVMQRELRFGAQRKARDQKSAIRPREQSQYYMEQWELNRQEILKNIKESNQSVSATDAYWMSVTSATGGHVCGYNTPASAWFFFTVMTTVGYGNQTPSSRAGKQTVIFFGFISLLLFGILLALSGRVLTTLVDDALVINRLHFLEGPKLGFLFWGILYWGWMVVQARLAQNWKERRVGEVDVDMHDMFWFAFLSSTTIGLGDLFIEPEIIMVEDIFWLPFVFLIGFVLFSAFLGKMVELLAHMFLINKQAPFVVDILLGKLNSIEAASEFTTDSERGSSWPSTR